MTDRTFEEVTVAEGGQQRPGYRITCSRCDATDDFYQRGSPRRPPPLAASSHFKHRGWFVGNSARKDRCPDCLHKPPEKTAVQPSAPSTPPANPPSGGSSASQPSPLRAEAPRSMSKDERRIIFGKVDEFYVGATAGYSKGWNDNRVAQDLGVPRAWVSAVREEFFGPEHGSAETRALLETADKLASEVAAMTPVVERAKEALHVVGALGERIDAIQKQLGAIVAKAREQLGIDGK